MVISHSWPVWLTGTFLLRTEWPRSSNGSVYLKNKGKSGSSLLQECVAFPVVMVAVVVSDLTFIPCTWRNRMHLDIATVRRAARSDILLILLLRKAAGQEAGFKVQSKKEAEFRLHRVHRQLPLPQRRREGVTCVWNEVMSVAAAVPSGGQGFGRSWRNFGNYDGRADPEKPAALCQLDRPVRSRWACCDTHHSQKHKFKKILFRTELVYITVVCHRYGGGFVWKGRICVRLPE